MPEEMTLEKAIAIIADATYNSSMTFNEDFKDALKIAHRCMVEDLNIHPGGD